MLVQSKWYIIYIIYILYIYLSYLSCDTSSDYCKHTDEKDEYKYTRCKYIYSSHFDYLYLHKWFKLKRQ